MELVVCRCMRERDYLTVMSALLNTITPYRSERGSEEDILPARACVELCVIWDYTHINDRFLGADVIQSE